MDVGQNVSFQQMLNKQTLLIYASICLCLSAFVLWLYIPYSILSFNQYFFLIAFLGVAVLSAIPFLYSTFKHKQKKRLFRQINRHPEMEYSTPLLFKESQQLNSLEKIQLSKIEVRLQSVLSEINIHHFLGKALFCFIVNFILVGYVVLFQLDSNAKEMPLATIEALGEVIQPTEKFIAKIPQLKSFRVHIFPPKYTQFEKSTQKELVIEAPEGSKIEWGLRFDYKAPSPSLEIDGQSFSFNTKDSINYWLQYEPRHKTLYSLQIDTVIKSNIFNTLYAINIIPDKKPLVRISNLKSYQQLKISEIQPQTVNYFLQDDYGISKAELQLIKSSGDGESVSFEQKNYTLPTTIKDTEQLQTINLLDLKPQAGDEFFIRIEAEDNHPVKNQAVFSNTYIIAIEDTTRKQAYFTMALGMDREPEYFRSQRQIIIDTENLIEQKSKLSNAAFKDESNNLGIEQKLLRLRYGKFLGEEFEGQIGVRSSKKPESQIPDKDTSYHIEKEGKYKNESNIEPEHVHEHNHHNHEDCDHDHTEVEAQPINKNEHTHNEDCDHEHLLEQGNAVHQKKANDKEHAITHEDEHGHTHDHSSHNHDHGHDHGGESENPEEPINWIAPFQHFHDNAESNTFFESEVKAKLKAALAQMWDAELQLRLGKPSLSLPFQQKALKLIKEVQQASRVYVERVGIDLPKIDVAKKRLSGELDEITDPKHDYKIKPEELVQNIYKALQIIDDLKQQKIYNKNVSQNLSSVKVLLAGLRHKNENCYVQCIHSINQVPNDKSQLQMLKFLLNSFLKEYEPLSGKTVQKNSRLEDLYWGFIN